jgi:hypothetical protein
VGIFKAGSHPVFRGCTIRGNQAMDISDGGGGVNIQKKASSTFVNTVIEKNIAQGAGGAQT